MTTLFETYKKLDLSSKLNQDEKLWIEETLSKYPNGNISIREMWKILDEIWNFYNCDQLMADERFTKFYSHPVWLLNGMHIETDSVSLSNRRAFAEWVKAKGFKRIADFGGGFGGLARLIGESCVGCEVDIIDPFPHPAGIFLAEKTENVKYKSELTGKYDLIIATDVFEHVMDPLGMIARTSMNLNNNGYYLVGNCFEPVILCHLPCTFHFRGSWDVTLKHLGLEPQEKISYARVFQYSENLNLDLARKVEKRSRRLFNFTKYLPKKLQYILTPFFLKLLSYKYDLKTCRE
jgi:hypothetical protein